MTNGYIGFNSNDSERKRNPRKETRSGHVINGINKILIFVWRM